MNINLKVSMIVLFAVLLCMIRCARNNETPDSAGISTLSVSDNEIVETAEPVGYPRLPAMEERVTRIKASTVSILVDGKPSGTGFVIRQDGLIATCFHVVQSIQQNPSGGTTIGTAPQIEVVLNDGRKLTASVHPSCSNGDDLLNALSKDYMILKVDTSGLASVKIGTFNDMHEGSYVYQCGFPLSSEYPIVSMGIVSTHWQDNGYLGDFLSQNGATNLDRHVAYLDITMNKGNSGAPVVLIGTTPDEDEVIGIASFILNPYANTMGQVAQHFRAAEGSIFLSGADYAAVTALMSEALASTSMGIGGCVAIDYLGNKLSSIPVADSPGGQSAQ